MLFQSSIRFGLLTAVLLAFGQITFAQTNGPSEQAENSAFTIYTVTTPDAPPPCPPCPDNSANVLIGGSFLCPGYALPFTATQNCSDENLWTWTWTAESNCTIVSSSGNTATIQATASSGTASFRVGASKAGCISKSKRFTLPINPSSSCTQ